jgi:hypothetical protein
LKLKQVQQRDAIIVCQVFCGKPEKLAEIQVPATCYTLEIRAIPVGLNEIDQNIRYLFIVSRGHDDERLLNRLEGVIGRQFDSLKV